MTMKWSRPKPESKPEKFAKFPETLFLNEGRMVTGGNSEIRQIGQALFEAYKAFVKEVKKQVDGISAVCEVYDALLKIGFPTEEHSSSGKNSKWYNVPDADDKITAAISATNCLSKAGQFEANATAIRISDFPTLGILLSAMCTAASGQSISGGKGNSKTIITKAAHNRLEKLASFQFAPSGQVAPSGENIPLLVSFSFKHPDDEIESQRYSFDLRHAYLRVDLAKSVLAPQKSIEFAKWHGENRNVELRAELVDGGAAFYALWKLDGGESLIGTFDFEPVGYTNQRHKDDCAYLQIMAKDIRVKLSGTEVASEAASDVAKQWLRIKKILPGGLPDNGIITISEQAFDEE